FMTTRVPLAFRARALALLGGSFRLGIFIGPFVTAALLEIFGSEHAAIWFFLACLISLVVLVLFGPDPEKTILPAQTAASPAMSECPRRCGGTGACSADSASPPRACLQCARHARYYCRYGVSRSVSMRRRSRLSWVFPAPSTSLSSTRVVR